MIDKKTLSERDICTKFITPALEKVGWDKQLQILEEVSFTDGKIYVRGKITARGTRKRADYILYYKPNIPIAIIEKERGFWRYIIGGTLFGLGWALVGSCPGPIFILLGTGTYAVAVVFIGALLGTYIYGLLKDYLPH